MKNTLASLAFASGLVISLVVPSFASTEQEKAFVDSYKKAFEAKDGATLEGFLYTKGSDPMATEFYKMMMTAEMGGKVSKIELLGLTPEETAKATAEMPSPTGGKSKLPLTPTKKLVLSVETGDANGTSTSTSESFVAEVDGKFLIPVPAPVK